MLDPQIDTRFLTTNNKGKVVRFSDVEIREHPIELGDHPCPAGPALTIGWVSQRTVVMSVDEFEHIPKNDDFRISKYDRRRYILSIGHTAQEIAEAVLQASAIRKSRSANKRCREWADNVKEASKEAVGKTTQRIMNAVKIPPLRHITENASAA